MDAGWEESVVLIRAIQNELRLGTKHYDSEGRLLSDVRSILAALVVEGGVTIEPKPARRAIFKGYAVPKSV